VLLVPWRFLIEAAEATGAPFMARLRWYSWAETSLSLDHAVNDGGQAQSPMDTLADTPRTDD
jgi:hypothetical protein